MTAGDVALPNFVLCAGGLLVLGYAALVGWLYDLRDPHRHNQSLAAQSVLITVGLALFCCLVAWWL